MYINNYLSQQMNKRQIDERFMPKDKRPWRAHNLMRKGEDVTHSKW